MNGVVTMRCDGQGEWGWASICCCLAFAVCLLAGVVNSQIFTDWAQGIAAFAMLCACCASCGRCAWRYGEIFAEGRDDRQRRQPTARQAEEYDLEGQQFRMISLSRHQDGMIVASSLAGDKMFCIPEPTGKQSHVLLDKIATALHTQASQLSLYESDRCLGYSDVIQDMNLITLRQALPNTEAAIAPHKIGDDADSRQSLDAYRQRLRQALPKSVDVAPTVRMMQMPPISIIAQVMPPASGTLLQPEANAEKQVPIRCSSEPDFESTVETS